MSVCSAGYVNSISKRVVPKFNYVARENSNQVPSTEISKANYLEHKMFFSMWGGIPRHYVERTISSHYVALYITSNSNRGASKFNYLA